MKRADFAISVGQRPSCLLGLAGRFITKLRRIAPPIAGSVIDHVGGLNERVLVAIW